VINPKHPRIKMLRPIALALALPALRLAGTPLRLASTSTAVLAHPEAEYEKFMQPLKAPGIRANAHAYVWEVPKDLPENDFIRRRQAVADHAECECARGHGDSGGGGGGRSRKGWTVLTGFC